MIARFAADYSIRELCNAYEVSRHGYDHWRSTQGRDRQSGNERLVVEIKTIHKKSRYSYGAPKITKTLQRKGYHVNHKRVAKLMKENNIRGRRRKRFRPVTTDSNHGHLPAPHLLTALKGRISGTNQAWVRDITYIPTREGWLYLAAEMDLFSRRIVGWACSTSLKTDFVNLALQRAIRLRQPPRGLIAHSDRGVQYAAQAHRQLLEKQGIIQSMSRKGNCYDNAAMESFFSLLKAEVLPGKGVFNTRKEALKELFKYIETEYNRTRIHSSLGYISPVDFEKQHAKLQQTA